MAAATDDYAAAVTTAPDFLNDDDIDFNVVDGLDFNIDDGLDFNIDVVRDLDFDLGDLTAADEFRDAYAAFLASADANDGKVGGGAGGGGWIAGLCGGVSGGGEESGAEGSTTSSCVTTDDGVLAGDEAMSEFVAELERFLMDDAGDCEAEEAAFCPDDFFGDLLATSAALDGGVATGADDDDNDAVLAAREDHQASRKRARHEIKGTTAVTPWRGELEVTMSMRHHLARMFEPVQLRVA